MAGGRLQWRIMFCSQEDVVSKVAADFGRRLCCGMTAEELDMVNQAREKLVEIIRPFKRRLKERLLQESISGISCLY